MALKRKTEKIPRPGRGEKDDAETLNPGSTSLNGTSGTAGERQLGSTMVEPARAPGGSAPSSMAVAGPFKGRLGDLLMEKGLITSAQLDQALAEQQEHGGKLGELLVNMGALDAQVLADALAAYFGLVVVNLRRDNVDPAVITMVPEEMARQQLAIPVRLEADGLYVAVAEPSDELRAMLASATKQKVNLMIEMCIRDRGRAEQGDGPRIRTGQTEHHVDGR